MSFCQSSSDQWQASDGLWYPGEQHPEPAPTPGPVLRQAERAPSYLVPFKVTHAYRWSCGRLRKDIGVVAIPTLLAGMAIGGTVVWTFSTYDVEPNAQWGYPSLGSTLLGILLLMVILMLYQIPVIYGVLKREGDTRASSSATTTMTRTNIVAYLSGTVLLSSLTALGTVLCVVPGVAVALYGYYFGWFVLDEGLGPLQAIRASASMVAGNFAAALEVAMIGSLVLFVGGVLACVGLFVALPLAAYSAGYSYLRLRPDPAGRCESDTSRAP